MRTFQLLCMGCAFTLLFAACNDDGGGGGGGDGLTGVHFTGANAAQMVAPVANVVDFLPGLSQAISVVMEKIDAASSSPALPGAVIDLGDLGICSTGQATGSWNDADASGDLTPGDAVTLQVTNCDGEVSGTLGMAILTSGTDSGSADLSLNMTITDQVGGATQTAAISGLFRLEVEGTNPPGGMVFRYSVPENTNGSLGFKVVRNGTTLFEMGCFNFYFTFRQDGTYTLSEPVANIRIPGEGILSMSEWGADPMTFTTDDYPESGQLSFWAEANALPCARLGIPSGGVDSNDSRCVLTATGGGNLTLAGETSEGQPFSVQTTWDDIR